MTAPTLEQAPVFVGQLTDAQTLANVRHRHRLSALVYERMARLGAFEGLRVELIDGEIIEMPPMGEPHAASVTNTTEELVVPFRGKMKVRNQTPLNAGSYGRPEPDVAVVSLDALLLDQPPSRAELVVEVSDSTLKYDHKPTKPRFTPRSACPIIGLSTCKRTCWKCGARPSNGPVRVLGSTIR